MEHSRREEEDRGKKRYIRSFEVIGLTESWLEEKEEDWLAEKLQVFVVKQTPAMRLRRRGRSKGGLVIAVKKDTEVIKEIGLDIEKRNKMAAIKIQIEEEEITCIVTYMRENRKEEIERIVERNIGEKVLIGGDFNARTAEEGGRMNDENTCRRSKDKVRNKEGEDLIKKIRNLGL